jgi:transposase
MELIENQRLDHLGIIAGIIKDLGLIEFIDSRIPSNDAENISAGEAIAGMILNGLGFSDRPLSLTPQFFENKPLEVLFRPGVQAEHFNRFKLGRSLDDAHAYGCELIFSEIAKHVCQKEGIDTRFQSLDTTTFSLTGNKYSDSDEHEIKITHGYSKDHRPDLKQVVHELIVAHDGGVPLIARSLSGNASDNKVFAQRSKAIVDGLKNSDPIEALVADSKLYSESNAENLKQLPFITRIPGIIKEELQLIERALGNNNWQKLDDENQYQSFSMSHYGIDQRWIVVNSEAAQSRAKKSMEKLKVKESEALAKSVKKLQNKEFGCKKDAQSEVEKLQKTLKLHNLVSINYIEIMRHKKRGRPTSESKTEMKGWRIEMQIESNEVAIQRKLNSKSCYVLGTNVATEKLTDQEIIAGYKSQGSVEMGFRFLKDPVFFTSSLFVKKTSRISGLLMVMTLALLVYSIAQRRLRGSLKTLKMTLPNQIKQESDRPTLRWIFQLMEGVNWVKVRFGERDETMIQGLTELRKRILNHFGSSTQAIYRLKQ